MKDQEVVRRKALQSPQAQHVFKHRLPCLTHGDRVDFGLYRPDGAVAAAGGSGYGDRRERLAQNHVSDHHVLRFGEVGSHVRKDALAKAVAVPSRSDIQVQLSDYVPRATCMQLRTISHWPR